MTTVKSPFCSTHTMAWAVCVALACSAAAHAKPYVDTKKRFSLDLAAGWQMAPMPGDTQGMIFKKSMDGVPGSFRVSVRELLPGELPGKTLDAFEAPFHDEIGFKPGTDVPAQVGLFPAIRRTFSVYASGDAQTVRAIEVYVVHAFGFAHVLHFETVDSAKGRFARDVDHLIGTYECLAGRAMVGPLVGKWRDDDGGHALTLDEDGRFALGPLVGTWRADRSLLALRLPGGEERYRYELQDATMKLTSSNLDGVKTYVRQGPARFVEKAAPKKQTALTRQMLIGSWRVVDAASTDPLTLKLAPSGSVAFGGLSGRWDFSTARLTITSTAGVTITYSASVTDGKLSLEGGDLDRPITLVRE